MKGATAFAPLLSALALAVLVGSAYAQQAYPTKPIRIVSPYPPGGSTTVYARLIGQRLTDVWGKQVVVDNRGGGNTLIGSDHVAKSVPDGYTLMLMTTTHVIVTQLISAPYDPIRDFAPIATVGSSENILGVHPSLPVGSLKEFIAFAKARPGQLNYGTSGSGSVTHLAIELFRIVAGINMQPIPYKGSGPLISDFLGGHIEVYLNSAVNYIPLIKQNRVKALAVTGEKRLPAVPTVPTFAEAGLPNYSSKGWSGIIAPAATPKPIVDKLSNEIMKALAQPEFIEKMRALGVEPFITTPEQFGELMKSDMAKYAKVIKTAKIKID
jgi:tripartite-type tricarboxylate transporter receptor subunit TctC